MKLTTILKYFLMIALSLSLVGCGLYGSLRTNRTEIGNNLGEELPEWLTVAHRVQAAEQPIIEPAVNQPASTQPRSTQPAQQVEQQTPASGTPRWKQPGTMEYIAKQQLDQLVFTYKRLNSDIADLEAEKDKDDSKIKDLKAKIKERADLYKVMSEIAVGIGLSLEKEDGITPPPVEKSATDDSTWFNNWDESPSGFGN